MRALAVTPSEHLLASGGTEGDVKLWDVRMTGSAASSPALVHHWENAHEKGIFVRAGSGGSLGTYGVHRRSHSEEVLTASPLEGWEGCRLVCSPAEAVSDQWNDGTGYGPDHDRLVSPLLRRGWASGQAAHHPLLLSQPSNVNFTNM